MLPGTDLVAWHGACVFSGAQNPRSNYLLGQFVGLPVLVGGAEDLLSGGYISKGAHRDVLATPVSMHLSVSLYLAVSLPLYHYLSLSFFCSDAYGLFVFIFTG